MKILIAFCISVFIVYADFIKAESDSVIYYGLSDLIRYAEKNNSLLEPVEIQRKIELLKKDQLNKQPAPMLEAMIDYIPYDFSAKPEYSGFYTQRLLLAGKLDANELIGNVKAEKESISLERLKIDLKRQIKSDYFNLYYYERIIEFNNEYKNIISRIIKTLEANYSSGIGTQSSILKMNNELLMLDYELIEFETKRKLYVNNLRVLTSLNIPDEYSTKGIREYIEKIPKMDPELLTKEMIKNNPEFKMVENMIEESRAERKMNELEKIPDLTLKGGYRYMAEDKMSFFNFTVGVDLTFMPWNLNRINALIKENQISELKAGSLRNSALQYMQNELQGMLIMINSLNEKIKFLEEVFIPQVKLTFNSSLAAYSSGSDEFMNLLDTFRKLRETLELKLNDETDLLKQTGELEFLIGNNLIAVN